MSAIALSEVSVGYGRIEIVRGVSLEVERGEWVAVIGPNGAGKTTLLRAIAGLAEATGTIEVGGANARALGRREQARRLALVPQSPVLPPEMTVQEYVLLGRTPHVGYLSSETRHDRDAAAAAIARLGLEAFGERPLATLSGGEAQRAVLARALAQQAEIVLLDEPTSALDIGRQQQVLDLVDLLRTEDGLTVVAAMHDLTLASQYASRLFLLDNGELIAWGTPAQILRADLLAEHYGAAVRVLADGPDLIVVPARRPREDSPCAH